MVSFIYFVPRMTTTSHLVLTHTHIFKRMGHGGRREITNKMSTSIRNNTNLLDLLVTNRLGERKSTTRLVLATNPVLGRFPLIFRKEKERANAYSSRVHL